MVSSKLLLYCFHNDVVYPEGKEANAERITMILLHTKGLKEYTFTRVLLKEL